MFPEPDLIFEHLYPTRKRVTKLGDGGEVITPNHQLIVVEDSIHKIISILNERGHRALIIGGAVRDALLGISPKDVDIEVYKISYEELEKVLSEYGSADLVGRTFGTILFKPTGSDMTYDFSIPRKENKVGIGHKGFKVFFDKDMTIKEAGARRDFTWNALAYDPLENKIYDYFGGIKDLDNKIIRHTSSAFSEDSLRVLRAMQFQARFDFTVHPDTIAEMKRMLESSDEFDNLPRKRLFDEWSKWAIKGIRHDLIFKFMRDTGLIEKYPDLKALAETPQDYIYHPEGNVEIHTEMTLREMDKIIARENIVGEEKLLLVMSILLHDIGKPATTKEEMKKGRMTITSNGHESLGGTMSRDILAKMGFHEELITPVDNIVSNHLAGVSISMITAESGKLKAVKKLSRRLYPATIKQLMYVIEADSRGRGGEQKEPTGMKDLEELSLKADVQDKPYAPILKGRDLIAVGLKAPSPKFGEIIRASFEAQESGEFSDIEGAKKWLNENLHKFGSGGAVEIPRDKSAPKVLDADVEGRGGLIVGDSHADGGVPFVLEDSGTHIEEEGEEANLPNEIKDIEKVYTFKGKNHEVIHKILQLVGLKLSNKVTSVRSGDLVICKASLWDDTVRTYTGTPIQIVSAVNESEGCNHIESGATMIENGKKVEMKKGGEVRGENGMKILYGDKFRDTTPCGMSDDAEMDMVHFGGGGKIKKPVAEVIDDIEYYLRKKYVDQAEKILSLPIYSDIVTKKYQAREELIDWVLNSDNDVKVIIAFSGGKDSVAMVLNALDMGVKKENIELWHHDVDGNSEDLFDWKCTKSYCEAFAKAFGLKILFSYKQGGIVREIYKNNEETQPIYYQEEMGGEYKVAYPDPIKNTRMRFPAVAGDLQTRWCSYEVKINVMQKAINGMNRFRSANMLIMTGERRQESKKRGTYLEILPYRSHGKARRAIQWRPILDWSEKEVWAIYEKHKVQPHPCYELGWGRCSCQLCIFSSPNTWATINEVSPDKVNRIREIEVDIKHTLYHEEEKVQVGVREDGKPKFKKTGKMYDGVYETKVNKGKSFLLLEKRSRWLKEALGEFVSPIIVDKWELPIGAFNGEDAGAN